MQGRKLADILGGGGGEGLRISNSHKVSSNFI